MIDTRRPDNLSGILGILSGKVRLINQYIGVLNQDSILLHQNISLLNPLNYAWYVSLTI